MVETVEGVAKNLEAVRTRIGELSAKCGIKEPRLVAVSKLQPDQLIVDAHAAGQKCFGENYVKELVGKAPGLPADIEWHFIGMLQSNKAKTLVSGVPNLAVVESVHSAKTASALEKACVGAGRTQKLKVMIQVLTSGEESKSGCDPEECTVIAQHIKDDCPLLELVGLMTIGKFGDPNPEPYFQVLKQCRARVAQSLGIAEDALELSMGMSGDYDKAIAAGSTSVRVGTSIFGLRPPKSS